MALQIRIPRLGWSMEVGTFVAWLKKDGDQINEGDAIYELEGEKASQEIESIDSGILRIPPDAPIPGTELPVGALLGYLVGNDEPNPWETPDGISKPAAASESHTKVAASDGPVLPKASPAVRKLALELNVPLANVRGSGKRGQLTRGDVEQYAARETSRDRNSACHESAQRKRSRLIATPRARRLARELDVDLTRLDGSGRNGRIRARDVLHASSVGDMTTTEQLSKSVPTNKLRRVIADRVQASHRSAVPVTLTTRANAAQLLATRAQFKKAASVIIPTLNDIMIKLVAAVLQQDRLLAGQWRGDHIVLPPSNAINVGLAVDTEDGLLVPVVNNAAEKSVVEIARATADLIERARSGRLTLGQLQGGVFTISNLGPLGIDVFTPVINVPESAILGIGAIRREAIVEDNDQIRIGSMVTLNLTFDHRVVDGAPAARFLASVRRAIENPVPHLI